MRRAAAACLSLVALLLFPDSGSARQPYRDLKGLNAITYHAHLEQDSNRCRIERESLDTALQFVANQSVKLKLIPWLEHDAREKELRETAQQIWNELTAGGPNPEAMFAAMNNPKYKAVQQVAYDYGRMPRPSNGDPGPGPTTLPSGPTPAARPPRGPERPYGP
jgi:hypothetical protein